MSTQYGRDEAPSKGNLLHKPTYQKWAAKGGRGYGNSKLEGTSLLTYHFYGCYQKSIVVNSISSKK